MAMKDFSALWLGAMLCAAIVTIWIPGAWINPSLFEAGVFLLAGCWAARMIWRPYQVRGSWVLACLGFGALWPLAQLALGVTVSRWDTWRQSLLWSADFAGAFLALQIFSGEGGGNRRAWFLRALGFFAFGILLLSLLDSLTGEKRIFWFDQGGLGSPFGPFVNRNTLAAFGELALPLILYRAFQAGGLLGTGLMEAGMAAGVYAAVIAGGSRTGAAVATAEILLLLWMGWKRGARGDARRVLGAFAVMAAIFVAAAGVATLAGRLEGKESSGDRKEMALSALEMVRERPWFGVGLGNFENAYPKYARFDSDKVINHAHNDWAEWAATGGWPLFVAMCLAVAWTAPRAYRSAWGIGILAMFVHCLTDFPFEIGALQFWVFTLIGVLAAETTKFRTE
jgi:hypothetical protein